MIKVHSYQKENKIIQKLAKDIFRLVEKNFGTHLTIKHKKSARDIVSSLDKKLDNIIVGRLNEQSNDLILSEETSPNLDLNQERLWVIDPLCGSRNAAGGVKFFSTNIVLVEQSKVVAAWIIDHAQKSIIWGLGDKIVFRNDMKLAKVDKPSKVSYINIDWGHFYKLDKSCVSKYANFVRDLIVCQNIHIFAFDSTLALAYVASGQFQAAVIVNTLPWDFLGASFLVEQNGGKVTNIDGSPWTINSKHLIMASNKKLHADLLRHAQKNNLASFKN